MFLMDSIGALLSALLLAVVLVRLESWFGMPENVLYGLSAIAFCYALYSACCYFFITLNWRPCLKAIAIANILYACLTFGLVLCFFNRIRVCGLVYFSLELLVMSILIVMEFRLLAKVKA